MVKYYNFDIVFAEVPDEVTLAINITNCPNRCVGCHSPHLQQDVGRVLDEIELGALTETYVGDITCVCFMGGDATPKEIESLSLYIKKQYPRLKTAWYSGKSVLSSEVSASSFDYIKLGGYNSADGPLNSQTTNQKMYRISDGTMEDITSKFWKK